MANKPVDLSFTERGISTNPSTVHASKRTEDTVTWTFGGKPSFTIYFDGLTPFEKAHIESVSGTAQSGQLNKSALPGVYKYIIAAEHRGKVEIACPCVCCEC